MSIRLKITLGYIVINLSLFLCLLYFTNTYINQVFVKEVQERVNYNIGLANDIYNDYIGRIGRTLKLIPIHNEAGRISNKVISDDLGKAFDNSYIKSRIDLLIFTDSRGNVLYRAHNPGVSGDNISDMPVIRQTIADGKPHGGTIILDENHLKTEGRELMNRSVISVMKTPNSLETPKTSENRGMLLVYALPVFSKNGYKKLGVLLGGYLLNNTTELVDKIKYLVFHDKSFEGKDIGTATIFFDDVRIATNVKLKDNSRAVGSRLSKAVYDHVISKGGSWANRAFVVNDWYITAYEPIKDVGGKIIGALYIGLLEKPFKEPQKVIMWFFVVSLILTVLAMVVGMFFYTKVMMRPIEHITSVSKKIMAGDMSSRCGITPSGEMGVLCATIDKMADALEQHLNKMKEDTRVQIMQSEKLASVGRLAAGVAHEINNPLTGVLTFAHFLKEKKSNDESDLHDINVIIRETTRVREIIRGLLDFARQTPANKSMINVNETIQQLLVLVKGQKEFKNIRIIENYDTNLKELFADKNQLQQVFLNLLLNSGEAIAGSGDITIFTSFENDSIKIIFSDSGCGINPENIDRIFDPFFTTKPVGKGTGLGLSVSYGIIRQHDGTIRCESAPGDGTKFTITLPVKNV